MKEVSHMITKQAINRMLTSNVVTWEVNGCYNVAIAQAVFSKYRLELKVAVTHPLLKWANQKEDNTELVRWNGYDGFFITEIPSEWNSLIESMKQAATMPDDIAQAKSDMLQIQIADFLKEMDIV